MHIGSSYPTGMATNVTLAFSLTSASGKVSVSVTKVYTETYFGCTLGHTSTTNTVYDGTVVDGQSTVLAVNPGTTGSFTMGTKGITADICVTTVRAGEFAVAGDVDGDSGYALNATGTGPVDFEIYQWGN